MRFLHKDFAPIAAHLANQPCDIRLLEWEREPIERSGFAFLPWTRKRRPAHPPRLASAVEVKTCFDLTQRPDQAAAVLAGYFHVNAPPSDRAVSLSGAVEHVEAFGGPVEFLLVGHPAGGLVSVSRTLLPFQEGAEEARGWGP